MSRSRPLIFDMTVKALAIFHEERYIKRVGTAIHKVSDYLATCRPSKFVIGRVLLYLLAEDFDGLEVYINKRRIQAIRDGDIYTNVERVYATRYDCPSGRERVPLPI